MTKLLHQEILKYTILQKYRMHLTFNITYFPLTLLTGGFMHLPDCDTGHQTVD